MTPGSVAAARARRDPDRRAGGAATGRVSRRGFLYRAGAGVALADAASLAALLWPVTARPASWPSSAPASPLPAASAGPVPFSPRGPVSAAAGTSGEAALQRRAEALTGWWFAPADDPAEARVLRVTDVIFIDDSSAALAGVYGPASAPFWPEAGEITLRPDGGRWLIEIVPADGARVTLAIDADGTLRSAHPGPDAKTDGKADTLRFVPAALSQIHRYAASHPLPPLRAGANARIEFVYIGAHDCSMCRQWEGIHLGRGGRLSAWPPWPRIEFTAIRLASLRRPFAIDDAPARLHPLLHDMLARGVRIRGVPSFLLLVDGRLRAHALGPLVFDSLLFPALRAAVAERAASSYGDSRSS